MNETKLVIFPTLMEADGFLSKNKNKKVNNNFYKAENYDILISGPGIPVSMLNIITHLNKFNAYKTLIMAGLAGTYKEEIDMENVFCVKSENFGDLGVNNQGIFEPLYNIKEWAHQYQGGTLTNPNKELLIKTGLRNITSNTVNLNNSKLKSMPDADIENMEGASFFLIAEKFGIPYLEIRAISNYTGERDKSKWKIEGALNNIAYYLKELINTKL